LYSYSYPSYSCANTVNGEDIPITPVTSTVAKNIAVFFVDCY
jgi:hypothetical protein